MLFNAAYPVAVQVTIYANCIILVQANILYKLGRVGDGGGGGAMEEKRSVDIAQK